VVHFARGTLNYYLKNQISFGYFCSIAWTVAFRNVKLMTSATSIFYREWTSSNR